MECCPADDITVIGRFASGGFSETTRCCLGKMPHCWYFPNDPAPLTAVPAPGDWRHPSPRPSLFLSLWFVCTVLTWYVELITLRQTPVVTSQSEVTSGVLPVRQMNYHVLCPSAERRCSACPSGDLSGAGPQISFRSSGCYRNRISGCILCLN